MLTKAAPAELLFVLRDTVVELVRGEGADLTARQMAVFLTVYLMEGPHTVRGLAADLNVSKPAITRALDRLAELDLARRTPDPSDGRSVLAVQTTKGSALLREIGQIMQGAELEHTATLSSQRVADTAPALKRRFASKAASR